MRLGRTAHHLKLAAVSNLTILRSIHQLWIEIHNLLTMKKGLLLAPLLAASAYASDLSYTHFDIGYSNGKAELPFSAPGFDNDLDIEGLFISGRYEITNNFFAYASFEDGEIDPDDSFIFNGDIDTMRVEAGLGAYYGIADCADVYFTVGYKYSELDDGDDAQKLGNIDINLGIRWAAASWLEVNPYVEQSIGVDDDEFLDAVNTTTLGLNLYVTSFQYFQPFVGVSYEVDSSSDNLVEDLLLYSAGFRVAF